MNNESIKKKIATGAMCVLTGIFFILSCGSNDNGEEGGGGGDLATTYLMLGQYGLNTVNVSTDAENATFTLTAKRQGGDGKSELTAKLDLWSTEELEEYNKQERTLYTLLPATYYSVTSNNFVFASDISEVNIDIKFNPSEIFSIQKQTISEYVIPLKLNSADAKLRERECNFLLHISLDYGTVSFTSSDLMRVDLQQENTLVEINTTFHYKNTGEGSSGIGNFTLELSVPTNATELVSAYNEQNKTIYELLPQDNYTLGEKINYSNGSTEAKGTITVNTSSLAIKYYLLPVKLANVSDDRVITTDEIYYMVLGITYNNPVITNNSIPDPTVIRAEDGYFYTYATESSQRNMPIYRSKDLVSWDYVGTAFTNATRPSWACGGNALWAPEIRYINNQYVLYYSLATLNGSDVSSTGVAVSDRPDGGFIDKGPLLTACEFGNNSIDQFYYEENGKKYMFWGSFNGIFVTELTDDGFAVKRDENGEPVLLKMLCGNAFEGVSIYKKNGYYYMINSIGSCCAGESSNYRLGVGRSTELLGDYLDKKGNSMLNNSWELVLEGNRTKWIGPGHNSIIIQDDEGTEWLFYHSYRKLNGDFKGRFGMLDRLLWTDDGWPYVKNYAPSDSELIPVFN